MVYIFFWQRMAMGFEIHPGDLWQVSRNYEEYAKKGRCGNRCFPADWWFGTYDFPYYNNIGIFSSSQSDELICFRGVGQPTTSFLCFRICVVATNSIVTCDIHDDMIFLARLFPQKNGSVAEISESIAEDICGVAILSASDEYFGIHQCTYCQCTFRYSISAISLENFLLGSPYFVRKSTHLDPHCGLGKPVPPTPTGSQSPRVDL